MEDTKPQQPDKEPETPAQPPLPLQWSLLPRGSGGFLRFRDRGPETWPALMAVEGETLDTFLRDSPPSPQQCLVQMAMISASGDEIALVEVESSGDVQAVKDIFQARIDYQVGTAQARRCLVPRAHGDVAERVPDCLQWQLCDAGGTHRRGRGGGAVQRPVRLSESRNARKTQDF
ncbi:MAG: DUF4358 domain-containing protein [Dysosmobacter welbionis]